MVQEEFMVLPEDVPIKWVDEDNLHTLAANQFVLTTGTPWDEVILSVGQVSPPVLIGTPEEQLTQVKELDFPPRANARKVLHTNQCCRGAQGSPEPKFPSGRGGGAG